MSEEKERLQREINATTAAIKTRAREVEARLDVATQGAKLLTKQNPWILLGLIAAGGYFAAKTLTKSSRFRPD